MKSMVKSNNNPTRDDTDRTPHPAAPHSDRTLHRSEPPAERWPAAPLLTSTSHDSFFRQRRWSSNDTRWWLEASVSRKCRRRRNCQDTSRFRLTQKFATPVSPVHLDATRILHVQLYTTVGTLPTMGHERRFLQRCHLQCRTSAAAAYRAPPPRPAPPPPPAALSASRVRTTHPALPPLGRGRRLHTGAASSGTGAASSGKGDASSGTYRHGRRRLLIASSDYPQTRLKGAAVSTDVSW